MYLKAAYIRENTVVGNVSLVMCPKYEFYFQQFFAVVLLYVEKSLDAFSASLVFEKYIFSLFINEHVSSIVL